MDLEHDRGGVINSNSWFVYSATRCVTLGLRSLPSPNSRGVLRMKDITRRSFFHSTIVAAWTASCAHRVQPRRIRRVGLINSTSFPEMVAAFRNTLRDLGHIEGENLVLEIRLSRPNTADLAEFVNEFALLDLDVVVAASLPVALEVRKVMPATPMVIATCPGMVSNGFAQSLERPGGNVTGLDELPPGIVTKRLELLRTAAPQISRVALLSTTPGRGGHETQLGEAEETAARLGIIVKPYRVTTRPELEPALARMVKDEMNALLNFQGVLSLVNRQLIVDFVARHRMPAIYQATLFAEAGGLMAWAPDINEQFRVAARYADKILRGARPGDLPIQHPSRYYLTINRSAASAIGLSLPADLLARADRVVA